MTNNLINTITGRWRNPTIEWRGGTCTLPSHTHTALVNYIETGEDPYDDFFDALLTNDLKNAVHNADDLNLPIIHHITAWLYNFAPSACQGSEEKVIKWKSNYGMTQFQKEGNS
jgi:hypothetical protein